MRRRKILTLENPTPEEMLDAIAFGKAHGYNRIVAHGHKFRKFWGVRKRIIHLKGKL